MPFFWSQHYDVPINYVGHAEQWDEIAIDGDIKSKDCLLRYKRNGRVLAVASIFRDVENLQAELAMERALRLKLFGSQCSSARRRKQPWQFARQDLLRLLRYSSDEIGGARDVVNEARVLAHRQRAFIDVA